jgi:hypothetical protein
VVEHLAADQEDNGFSCSFSFIFIFYDILPFEVGNYAMVVTGVHQPFLHHRNFVRGRAVEHGRD